MKIEGIFEKCNFEPNDNQIDAIKHVAGPLLIIAGPGSGKTEVLIYRTLNLMICHDVKPENILLCTFTEKAAEQLKARLKLYLSKCEREDIDLAKMSVGTIHSICNNIPENLKTCLVKIRFFAKIDKTLLASNIMQPYYDKRKYGKWLIEDRRRLESEMESTSKKDAEARNKIESR